MTRLKGLPLITLWLKVRFGSKLLQNLGLQKAQVEDEVGHTEEIKNIANRVADPWQGTARP